MAIPGDVIVTDTWNLNRGRKVTIGFSCSHDFGGEPSGPIYFGQVRRGGGGHFEVWDADSGSLANYMGNFGAPLTREQVAALEQTRADANCG